MNVNPIKTSLCLLAGLLAFTTAWGYTYILNSNTGLPIKQPEGTVSIRIMLGTTPTLFDGTNYSSSAEIAAQTWNAQLGSVQFQSTITTGTAADHNGRNELVFAANIYGSDFGENVLAVTTTWRSGNERTEGDIIFNSARTWNSYDGSRPGSLPSDAVDLQRVAIHELGHALGLDHPDEAGQQRTAIMNSRISAAIDTLTSDDITGAQNLYGPPGIPNNDNFANAATLTLGPDLTVRVTGYNTNATKEPNEPRHAGNAGGHSVWWKWTAPASGSVTLDTRGSYFDTTLAVYTGTALANLAAITSNDDINPGIVQASTVTFTATANTTYYIAVDGFDADSAGITLNLGLTSTLPTITSQPVNQTVLLGDNASFSVTATGSGTLTYQWYFANAAISGATSSTLSLTNVQTANRGSYYVIVSNAQGSVTSNPATLTVDTTPAASPTITTQPLSQSVTVGNSASFSVTAAGSPTLTYQWYFASSAITGATGTTYSLANTQYTNGGSYFVIVTNSRGSVTSQTVTLTVNAVPTPTPTPTPTPSGGGGGGGAPSVWFLNTLCLLTLVRLRRSCH